MTKTKYQDIAVESYISHYHVSRPVNWSEIFGADRSLEVEIGFGLGEFLIKTSRRLPEHNFVGIEHDWKRVKKTLRTMNLINQMAEGDNCFQNVRVMQIEAETAFTKVFSPLTVNTVYCLFPCPWPKKSHAKHRLFSNDFLKLLNSRLVDKGSVRIVTDYQPYYFWIQEQLTGTGFNIEKNLIGPQFNTKFEKKWRAAGQEKFYEMSLIKEEHVAVDLEEDEELRVYFSEDFNPDNFQFFNVKGEISIIFKDYIFDVKRNRAMVRLVVAEKNSTQQVWISIIKGGKGWWITKAEGHTVLPTKGVAQAIYCVFKTVEKSCKV